MEKDSLIKKKLERVKELEIRISSWGVTNSQSNPGAVMELRDMRKELNAILTDLKKFDLRSFL
jgi:hypothetical protein